MENCLQKTVSSFSVTLLQQQKFSGLMKKILYMMSEDVQSGLLLSEARAYATKVLDADPELAAPQNAPLVRELRKGKYEIRDYSKIS